MEQITSSAIGRRLFLSVAKAADGSKCDERISHSLILIAAKAADGSKCDEKRKIREGMASSNCVKGNDDPSGDDYSF